MFESNEYFAANISKQKLLICFPFLMFTFLVSGLKKKNNNLLEPFYFPSEL